MKKILLIFLTSSTLIFAQNSFSKGFEDGYKKGFCYNKGIGCIEPIPPISPMPNINESSSSYQDGYNRGFQKAISSNNQTQERQRYKTAQSNYVDFAESELISNEQLILLRKIVEQKQKNNIQNYSETDYNINKEKAQKILDLIVLCKEFLKEEGDDKNILAKLINIENDITSLNYKSQIANNTEYFDEALNIVKKVGDYISKKSEVKQIKEVKNLIEEGKYTEADDKIKIYSKLTFDNDHLCYYHYLSTISKFYQNNYEATIKNASNSINCNPNISYEIYLYRGLSNSELNNYEISNFDYQFLIDNFTKINKTTSELATLYNNIGYNQIKMKNYSEAYKNIEKALILDENLSFIWDSKGELQFMKSDFTGSIKSMTKAISINSNSENSYYIRGLSYLKIGKLIEGCNDLKKAKELGVKEMDKDYYKKCTK